MNCEETRALLNDRIDGELTVRESMIMDEHLAGCDGCRREWEDLNSLLRRAEGLRRDVQPDRDLWPAILGDINRGKIHQISPEPLRKPFRAGRTLLMLAAACLAIIAGTIAVRYTGAGPDDPPVVVDRRSSHDTTPATEEIASTTEGSASATEGAFSTPAEAGTARQGDYIQVRRRLEETLRKERLAPETAEVIEKNLVVIDSALAEINRALVADPGNPSLQLMLTTTQRKAVDLLEQAIRL